MSAFTLVYTRAAGIFPNDTVNIPYPYMAMDGTNSSTGANLLIDSTVNFITKGIKIGDTVMSVLGATVAWATVIDVSATSLLLTANIFPTVGTDYFIYQGANTGCYLYTGSGGTVSALTAAGDNVSFVDLPAGTILPVQILRVNATGTNATSLVALW